MNSVYKFFIIFLYCAVLGGCITSAPQKGTVATVNGDAITLNELEKRRVAVFPHVSDEILQDKALLQKQYIHVLNVLIEEKLMEQYLQKKNIQLLQTEVDARLAQLQADFGAINMEQLIAEEGLTLEAWKETIQRQLLVELFYNTVLRPKISIHADEVKAYYDTHKQTFTVPEQWHILQFATVDKVTADKAKAALLASKNATQVQQQFPVTVHEIHIGKDRLPKDIAKDLDSLKDMGISKTIKVDTEFRFFLMLNKTASRALSAVEIYDRLQQTLIEEKLVTIYKEWIAARLAKSEILIHQALIDEQINTAIVK